MPALLAEPLRPQYVAARLRRVQRSRLFRQNAVLFFGGMASGLGGLIYHAIAGRVLGPQLYGEVASLVAIYTIGTTINFSLILVLAHYSARELAQNHPGALRAMFRRSNVLLVIPSFVFFLITLAACVPVADFLRLSSPVPVIVLGVAIVVCSYMAIPRGLLQGRQSFGALSANQGLELFVRTGSLAVLLELGLGVTGSVIAMMLGAGFAYLIGSYALRDLWQAPPDPVRMRTMISFALTATLGTLGVLVLYNVDVVLAKHYLDTHSAGIYGALNKIETIVYYGTLSVGQVLFPRVVEAVATGRHPLRLLFFSACLSACLGICALLVFTVLPGPVIEIPFGRAFLSAAPFMREIGLIGIALSLVNLLVQFFIAVHDRAFLPVLAAGCLLMVSLIALFHGDVGQVVLDVLLTLVLLLAGLGLRCLLLIPRFRSSVA